MEAINKEQQNQITNFKKRREKAELTIRQVEKLTGISNAYISQIETGKVENPSFYKVILLHNLYCKYEEKNNIDKASNKCSCAPQKGEEIGWHQLRICNKCNNPVK